MAFNPEEEPKAFLTIILAVGLKVFGPQAWSDEDRFNAAERFVAEAERRYGKLDK